MKGWKLHPVIHQINTMMIWYPGCGKAYNDSEEEEEQEPLLFRIEKYLTTTTTTGKDVDGPYRKMISKLT